jgi:NADPH-dependent curcumin reductase CurA
MARKGREVQLVEYPQAEVDPSHFRVVEVDVRDPGPGEVLVRNSFTSVDPGMRLRVRESGPPGYFNSFPLRSAMDGIMTVGEVLESRADGFKPSDFVCHASGWREYSVVAANVPALSGLGTLARIDVSVAPSQTYLGPLGGMGLTAYAGLIDAAGLREGDVVWVSAAAGAVGSLAAQIAKLRGNRVIGSAGSDHKVRYLLDELGLDAAFNYRDGPIVERLQEAAPGGIDVYFDNVGGDHLEAALATLRRWGRIALCGAVSEYDTSGPVRGPGNLFQAVANDLTLRGFRGSSYLHRFEDVRREIGGWLAEGRLLYRETVVDGLERAPEALVRMLAGDTTGKTLVRIAAGD